MQERALLGRARSTQNVPLPAGSSGVPWWMVAVVLLIFAAFGAMWTQKRRAARAAHDPAAEGKAMLNEINSRNVKARQKMEQEASRMQWLNSSTQTREMPRPVGFDENDAAALLGACPGFAETLTIHLPKAYRDYEVAAMQAGYPHLEHAVSRGVLIRKEEDGVVTHEVGQGAGGMRIVDSGAEFVVELGQRRVSSVVRLAGSVDRAEAEFEWAWEDTVGMRIFLGEKSWRGTASFLKQDGEWRVKEATLRAGDGTAERVCGGGESGVGSRE